LLFQLFQLALELGEALGLVHHCSFNV